MKNLAIILDTETTGITEPDVIELAHTAPIESPLTPEPAVHCLRFMPRKAISYGALATHHIFGDELAQCPQWSGSWSPGEQIGYIVGHNVDFDWKAIGSPNVKRICTLALSRHHWPHVDSHSLGAMTYATATHESKYELRDQLKFAHNASVDVALTHRLMRVIVANLGAHDWAGLWQLSEAARVPIYMGFGKYGPHEAWAKARGGPMKCADVRKADPSYYSWLVTKCDQVRDDPYFLKALTGAA